MPKYRVNGDIYNIPDDKAAAFEKRYPNATVDIYDNDGEEYTLPVSEKAGFQEQFKNWSYSAPSVPSAPSAPSSKKIDTGENLGPVMPTPEAKDADGNIDWRETARQELEKSVPEAARPNSSKVQVPERPEATTAQGTATASAGEYVNAPIAEDKQEVSLQQANREQVADLSSRIDDMLNQAQTASRDIYVQEQEEARKGGVLSTIAKAIAASGHNPEGKMEGMSDAQQQTLKGATPELQQDIATLEAAKRAMSNAQEVIAEADKSAQEGKFDGFIKGIARGFGDKFFDVHTWDMGVSDTKESAELLRVLTKFDKGEPLSESEQMLLDAKSVELATNAYFGSYIGRGYKAGSVTAQSLPFMIEMAINPASTVGESAQSMLARYAMRRFGKKAIAKAAGIAGRAVGDIAGSAIMAGTTGSIHVAGDAIDRSTGDIKIDVDDGGRTVFVGHEDGESLGKAIAKAFTATAIENHSEMLGEYFSPVLGALGAAGRKVMNKVGLEKAVQFVDDVNASDLAKLINDFQKQTKWNGTIGEYAEEVAGNIENAILVGDQTLDTDSDTGVFNLSQNIDTFLGVSLMGGAFSVVRTAGYRTPKYRARKDMIKARDKAAELYGEERWKDIEDGLANAGDEGITEYLTDAILNETDPGKKAALLDYAGKIKAYEGTLKGNEKHREISGPEMTDLETSYENGYTLATPQEVNDAKMMFEYQQQRLRDNLNLDDIDIDDVLFGNEMGSLTDEQKSVAMDYLNAKATYDGVLDHVRDDLDTRVAAVTNAIDSHVNVDNGQIVTATLKQDDRKVYIIGGNVVMTPDGTMVDSQKSEKYIIIKDAETGQISSVDPTQILRLDGNLDPVKEKENARRQIMQTLAQQEADKIDGVLPFNQGDTYQLTAEDGQSFPVQVVANEQGVIDNGDGTVNVVLNNDIDSTTGQPRITQMAKEQIQSMAEATNIARLQQHELQKAEERMRAAEEERTSRTQGAPYHINDRITITDAKTGELLNAEIVSEITDDGKYEVEVNTGDGEIVMMYLSPEELSQMNAQLVSAKIIDAEPEMVEQEQPEIEQETALSRIPVDKNGDAQFEEAQPSDTWKALVEMNEGDAAEAEDTAKQMYDNATKELDKAQKAKPKAGATVMEIQKNKAEYKSKLYKLQAKVDYWSKVLSFPEAERKPAAIAAENAKTEAMQQANDNLAKGRKIMQEKGTYYKEDSKLGDYLNFEDFALRMIANGRVKFVWKSDPNNSAIKGLGAHLGFEDNENERKRVFSILANADKGGLRPDEAAQELAEIYNSSNDNESIDTMQALDTILDIIRSYGGKTRDMMNAAIAAHADVGMDERGYMEDRQGNPINPDGTLYAESVSSIDEITDEDFTEPTRNIALPKIPENVDNAIGANGKPIIIKKNIFKRNSQVHPEVSPQQAREILSSALYRPDLYGQNQKTSRPYNWIVISTKDSAGQNRLVVLEVNENKDNVEIIHWYNARNSSIEQIKRQAQKEGGLILILPSETEEAGGLSSRQSGLSSEGKDTNIFEESNIETEKPVAEQITEQRKVVNTEPTEAQKEAGNYRMGHVKIDGMDVTIENPKGSIRRGTDADGKKWESEMHYDYGYIRGTKAVDNDHIDIFLSDNPETGNVFVVDQVNPKTGEFDESKVMYGFASEQEARDAYLSNYEEGWKGLGKITEVTKEEFKKWIDSSTRKTKPFSEYASVKATESQKEKAIDNQGNPINEDGTLKFDKIKSIDDLTDSDFSKPYRNVALPALPENVDSAIGAEGKPVIIKKSIFEKVSKVHSFSADESRKILKEALYNPDIVGQSQPKSKKNNWIAIKIDDSSPIVVLEVNRNKDNVEIVGWYTLDDRNLERIKRQAEREDGELLILTPKGAAASLSTLPSDLSSESKINKKITESQEDNRQNNKSEKIEDYGEQISGARKDMLRDLAKTIQNTSLESLISLPFSKAFKKPNLRKAVEEGALRDKDARFAQATIAAFLSTKKPVSGTKDEKRRQRWGQKTNVEKWAEKAYNGIKILQELFDADERVRDKVIEAAVADKYVGVAEAKAQQQRIGELNHREFNGTSYPLNIIALYKEVFDRLGYPAGQDTKIPVGRIVCDSTFDSYSLRATNGEDWIYSSRSLKSFEDVVDELVYLIKVANADETADHPVENFKMRGINPKVETTGYRVLAAKNITTAITRGNRFAVDETFPTREAALKRIEELKSKGLECSEPLERRETVGYEKYQISFAHPITREFIPLDKEYDSKEEAIAAREEEHEELNRLANEAIAAAARKSGESVEKSYFHITHYYDKGSDGKYHWYYGVALDDKYGPKKTAFNTMPFFLAERLNSREEAQKQIDANKERWESLVKDVVRQRSNFVYFSGDNETRNGEDYRNGKDVTAEEFANKFGFRGVQFGNWANQADRQAALNNAYDSFMDMSKIIGVSPKAMSLNGELGVAFGSRGSGAASAHYEPDEVVINLTKTRGAGSLAHEWWHALDNYFSRAANVKLGYVTSDKRLPMREEMRKAFNDLVDDVEKSDYHTRSMDRGSGYWGTRVEETARLFAEWIADEMAKRGELNNFLAGRNDSEDSYARMGYVFYRAIQKLQPEGEGEMMTFEEFRKTPMALKGFSYPTRAELESLGKDVRNIFGVVQERTDETTGNVALFQMVDKILSDNSPENRLAYEAVSQMLSNAGIPVELLSNQAMREMAINANALETVSSQNEYQQTVVSSASGAKIINNLDNLAKSLENEPKTKEKTFLGALAKALDAKKYGSNSQYATFEAKNGTVVTIRLANHNAETSTFDNHEKNDGISIVVSARENNGITNDGKAHVTEFYYDAIKLRKADGKPLADIVKSVKQSLYSGEYKDTTGLAQREEVNAKDVPEFMTVYHGSGAKFDRFDHSHMGEGEGAQAFGWGTYVTEVEGIGRTYAKAAAAKYLSKRNLYTVDIPEDINSALSKDEILKGLDSIGKELFSGYGLNDVQINAMFGTTRQWYGFGRTATSGFFPLKDAFKTYGIDAETIDKRIHDKAMENRRNNPTGYDQYLSWEKPLGEDVPNFLTEIDNKLYNEEGWHRVESGELTRFTKGEKVIVLNPNATGADIYEELSVGLGSPKSASEFLNSLGYIGISYPAQYTSGGRSDGARNYVIFNENDAKIVDRIEFLREPDGTVYGATVGGKIYLNRERLNPNTPIHEYTHLWFSALKDANPELYKRGVELMKQLPIWEEVRTDPNYANLSGDDAIASECLSRLVGDKGADVLTKMAKDANVSGDILGTAHRISLIEEFKDWLKRFWTWVRDSFTPWTKEEAARVSVDDIQNMVLSGLVKGVNPLARQAESDPYIRFSIVKDPKLIEELDKGPKVRVYRAMQLIDGKLYPPMASKINGEFVRPIELGKWEQADEHPELIDKNGRFNLNKGNGKGLKAAYNPYIHTSRTPLNDQFSEAQSRPNIVTVEVEIPKSELSSGYKADKAKDSVGEMEWKAGIVQGQLTGKRKVILSRWDKPIRIVPDSEVANVIVNDMFKGRTITMPSNVVTPSLRAELEKLGVPFVQTDNTGHIVGGQYDGKHYSKVYGNGALAGNSKSNRMESEIDRIVREAKENGTYMKAPNGKPTNLDERQWAQVRTGAFKKWFGDWEKAAEGSPSVAKTNSSKIVDENGEPKVVYDDNGQVIPLSERFVAGNTDIRYKQDGAENSRHTSQDVEAAATRLAESLGERVRIVRDVNEIENEDKRFQDNQRKSKGWFNTRTGEIVVVLPNATDIEDVQATILHEAVGHKGLRELVGDDRFDDFLDKVYAAASLETRKKIVDLAKQNHWNFRLSTEEYIAGLSETGFSGRENRTWFGKIKDFFLDMLSRAKIALGFNIGDNELRYMLWRTYQMRTSRGILAKANDMAIQQELKVGNFREDQLRGRNGFTENDIAEMETPILESRGTFAKLADAEKWAKENLQGKTFVNSFTGDEINISGHSIKEMLAPKFSKAINEKTHMAAIMSVPDFIETGIPAEIHKDTHGRGYDVMRLYNAIVIDGELYRVKSTVKRYVDGDRYYTYEIQEMELLKGTQTTALGLDDSSRPQLQSSITGANLLKGVKKTNFDEEILSDNDSRFRFRSSGNGVSSNKARDIYEEKTRVIDKNGRKSDTANLMRRLKEAYVDSMQSLKYLQDAISEETGKPVEDFENAYLAENSMSSKNKAQTDIFLTRFFNPIKDAIRDLQKEGAEYGDIVRYLMAKHGLERNEVFSKRDAEKDGGVWDGSVRRDYSGLTELTRLDSDTKTPGIGKITSRAERIVGDFEKAHNVDALWDTINKATKETLHTAYVSGKMTKENYNYVRSMFKYYIPLRGWKEDNASAVYDYLSEVRPRTSSIVKAATGRTSISDDPIATIAYMGQNAIIQGNRELMKQKLLNLAINHKTSLLTVSRQWEVIDPVTGVWEERNPIIPVDATTEQIADILSTFEKDMKEAENNGLARISRGSLDTGKHVTQYEGQEHVVRVMRGGVHYCIYVNGNPRAAQAVNGMTNPDAADSWLIRRARAVKNFMARMFTSQNPAFIVTNLSRDLIFAGTAVFAKEDGKYASLYTKNITAALAKGQMLKLIYKFEHDTLDDNIPLEKYFKEFIKNGGETGFTQLNTVDDFKRDIDRFASEMTQGQVKKVTTKIWNGIWDSVEFMNRCAEDATRFSVYMTSRQMGRSIEKSISDAKEVTVNFNRKGSGTYGARAMNFAYIFFNAAVQSLANAGKILYEHPVKATAALMTFSAAGFVAPLLAQAIIAAFGGDDDSYWDLPEWVRRNNFVFYIPWSKNKFLIIPISQELRPFYALGEIAMSVLMGKEEALDGLKSAAGSFMDLLPVDFMGNGGNLAVSLTPTVAQPFAQLVANTDYFGKPIYRRNDWNEKDPGWTKAYKGTNSMLVDATKWLNEVSGGDNVVKGWIDVNPAVVEHLYESYLGGVGKTLNKTVKTLSMIWDPDSCVVRNVPIVSTFIQDADDERTAGSQLNREYNELMREFDKTDHKVKGYKKQIRLGAMEYADKLNEFMDTPEFQRYSSLYGYVSAIRKIKSAIKYSPDEDVETLKQSLNDLKSQMVEEMENMQDGNR